MEVNHTIVFDEELYKENLEKNHFHDTDEFGGLSDEDLEQLKKEGRL
ncbi:MAG: hypothetical protein SPG13_00895 [Peptostreptococcus porci]|nr:hypothetical protein [Peptostreptococcus porci]MDY5478996.1 hypothetical protein [Peptostreptococcus porci]